MGSVLNGSLDELAQYKTSIAHFRAETQKAKVDVELQNHPLYDNFQDKEAKLKERKKGESNPFVCSECGKLSEIRGRDGELPRRSDRQAQGIRSRQTKSPA